MLKEFIFYDKGEKIRCSIHDIKDKLEYQEKYRGKMKCPNGCEVNIVYVDRATGPYLATKGSEREKHKCILRQGDHYRLNQKIKEALPYSNEHIISSLKSFNLSIKNESGELKGYKNDSIKKNNKLKYSDNKKENYTIKKQKYITKIEANRLKESHADEYHIVYGECNYFNKNKMIFKLKTNNKLKVGIKIFLKESDHLIENQKKYLYYSVIALIQKEKQISIRCFGKIIKWKHNSSDDIRIGVEVNNLNHLIINNLNYREFLNIYGITKKWIV